MTCSRMWDETIEHPVYLRFDLRFVFFIGSNADPDPEFYFNADPELDTRYRTTYHIQ